MARRGPQNPRQDSGGEESRGCVSAAGPEQLLREATGGGTHSRPGGGDGTAGGCETGPTQTFSRQGAIAVLTIPSPPAGDHDCRLLSAILPAQFTTDARRRLCMPGDPSPDPFRHAAKSWVRGLPLPEAGREG